MTVGDDNYAYRIASVSQHSLLRLHAIAIQRDDSLIQLGPVYDSMSRHRLRTTFGP